MSAGFIHWQRCLALLPHAEEILSLDTGLRDPDRMMEQRKMLHNMGIYDYNRGRYDSALTYFDQAKSIDNEFVDYVEESFSIDTWIIQLLSKLGESELAKKSAVMLLNNLINRDPGQIRADYCCGLLEKLARVVLDSGDPKTAELLSQWVLSMLLPRYSMLETLSFDAKWTLAKAINLQGEPEQAETLFRQAIDGKNRLLGQDHIDTLNTTVDLAQCLADQGRYDEAWEQFSKAREALERFPDQEKLGAQRVQSQWDEAIAISKQHGLPRLKRNLHTMWRRAKRRIVGSPRARLEFSPPTSWFTFLWKGLLRLLSYMVLMVLGFFTMLMLGANRILREKEKSQA
ncbi:hypothetical protein NW762_008906 [Fusarium torreyae]|uniref:Tetratricopeptide repeat protein n=1 Tax=Fusarium torreyae TaxID=1237075 RepID=A0A9W8RUS1_9HYPO|nr:hypothetical protein NW762_008906 [Fusarium torreyae]